MCCLFTTLVLFGPRLGILVWWLIQPVRWNAAFETFLWPFLGFLFLPWTTLMYVLVFTGGVTGFDWIWLALGLLADISSYTGGAYGNRNQIPGYGRRAP
jgi:hypothetical protein